MSPSALPWWGWLALAVTFWFFQIGASIYTDNGTLPAWAFRIALIVGMVLSAILAVVRFIKWAWQA
jgi:hypothetical protein